MASLNELTTANAVRASYQWRTIYIQRLAEAGRMHKETKAVCCLNLLHLLSAGTQLAG